jgi:hypothetical protein
MGAKKIQISTDTGTTWFTFPGNKGEYHVDGSTIDDTILGQSFKSEQSGMVNFSITTNGLYKGFAGYVAKIRKSGVATVMTASPMSLVSGKIFAITDSTKNIWDRTTAVQVFDNAVAVNATNILSIDYLFGMVTFKPSYTVTGPITVTGKYLPMAQVAKAQSFTLTQTAATIETTDFETAQANGGYMTYDYGLRTVWAFTGASTLNQSVRSAVNCWQNSTTCLVNYLPDGTTGRKGTAVVTECTLTGGLDAMNDFSIKFQGTGAPADTP